MFQTPKPLSIRIEQKMAKFWFGHPTVQNFFLLSMWIEQQNSHTRQNVSKQSTTSNAHRSPQTYMACVAWHGIGHQELNDNNNNNNHNQNNNNNNNNHIQRRYSRYFAVSSRRREPSPTRTLKWPGHVQHIERLSRASATWYEGTAQLLSLTELKSHLFELYFIG